MVNGQSRTGHTFGRYLDQVGSEMPNENIVPIDQDQWLEATFPLGAHLLSTPKTASFAVYAPAATRVTLEIFDAPTGESSVAVFEPTKGEDGIWRACLSGVDHGTFYGYRVWGPNWEFSPDWKPGNSDAGFISDFDEVGNRFNPNKLLFDPYAREISHTPNSPLVSADGFDANMFGTGGDEYFGGPRRNFDTAKWAPKGIIIEDYSRIGRRPNTPAEDLIIYEAHVKGLTMHPSSSELEDIFDPMLTLGNVDSVPKEYRGTYEGAAYLAPYLKSLGVTAIEFLPVHETSRADAAPGTTMNYWGYETLGFFAPIRAYAFDKSPGGPTREFKRMVKAFHREGIEVFLDVVYNHSGEGGHWGGDLNVTGFTTLGGFACPDYYTLTSENRLVDGATGVSNTINFSSEVACQLVLDSLDYWHSQMGVDGFRFDLAPVLGRKPADADRDDWDKQRRFFPDHKLLTDIRDWAAENHVEVIAEAWDLWGYEVGVFPHGWSEWNGRYRDAIRKFLKGDANTNEFMDMFNGDYQHFHSHGGPHKSINFITAHDGFTMADLVSYNMKNNNVEWPFGVSDGGSDANNSWDSGGDHALRRQRIRNFWVTLILSRGVPMIVAGDEYGRTQNGNNNPYAIDSIGIWQNWNQVASNAPHRVPVDPKNPEYTYHDNLGESPTAEWRNPIWRLASYLMNLRKIHPGLRQASYGNMARGDDDVSYLFSRPDGHPTGYHDRAVRLLIDCGHIEGKSIVALINMADHPVEFNIPRPARGVEWVKIIDTAAYAESEGNCWLPANGEVVWHTYTVQAWSIAVLIEHRLAGYQDIGSRIARFVTSRTQGKAKELWSRISSLWRRRG